MNLKELFIQLTDLVKDRRSLSYSDQYRAIGLSLTTGARMRSDDDYPVKEKYIKALALTYPFLIPCVEKYGIVLDIDEEDKDETIARLEEEIKRLEKEKKRLEQDLSGRK